jgi:hypothetical protein
MASTDLACADSTWRPAEQAIAETVPWFQGVT